MYSNKNNNNLMTNNLMIVMIHHIKIRILKKNQKKNRDLKYKEKNKCLNKKLIIYLMK